MTETMPTYKLWRENVERWMRQGEALEPIAAQHPDIPWEIDPIGNKLDWDGYEEDIQAFSGRVRKVAAIFGTPTSVKTTYANGDKAPDMEAKWQLDNGSTVRLWSLHPKCRIHPETHYVASIRTNAIHPAIHPECADVLRELEDYELETMRVLTDTS